MTMEKQSSWLSTIGQILLVVGAVVLVQRVVLPRLGFST